MKNYDRKEVDSFGSTKYYLNDDLHRTDGPALIFPSGIHLYYIKDKLHRLDGPAIHDLDNPNRGKQFWIGGLKINVKTTKQLLRYIKLRIFL